MQTQPTKAARVLVRGEALYSIPKAKPFFYRIWPPVMVVFGLGLTAAWTSLLGYGLVKLVEFTF